MKSFLYFMNSLRVTIGSSSMLNLLSVDQVSMATSTMRVLSCSLKICRIKAKWTSMFVFFTTKEKEKTKWRALIVINSDSHVSKSSPSPAVCCDSTSPSVSQQSVRSVWSCHQTAAHHRRLDTVNKCNSLKGKAGENWMVNNNVCPHKMEIYWDPRAHKH